MRSSVHRLRCTVAPCLHGFELSATGLTFNDNAKRYIEAIAQKEGWTLEPRVVCPQHVERAP